MAQQVIMQRRAPTSDWGTILGSLGKATQAMGSQYLAQNADQGKVEVPQQIGPVSDAELGINPGSHTLPNEQSIPGLDTLMAQAGVESMVGDRFNVGTPPPSPLMGTLPPLMGTPGSNMLMNQYQLGAAPRLY